MHSKKITASVNMDKNWDGPCYKEVLKTFYKKVSLRRKSISYSLIF